jgi:hypothetical protein
MKKKLFENVGGNSFKLNRITEAIEEANRDYWTVLLENLKLGNWMMIVGSNDSKTEKNKYSVDCVIERIAYSESDDNLRVDGGYKSEVGEGKFMFSIKKFTKGNTQAYVETTGKEPIKGYWSSDDIYAEDAGTNFVFNAEKGVAKNTPLKQTLYVGQNFKNGLNTLKSLIEGGNTDPQTLITGLNNAGLR